MSDNRKPQTEQTQQQLFALGLRNLANHLETFMDMSDIPPVLRKNLTLQELKLLLKSLEDLNLTGIDKILEALSKDIEEKGLAVNPNDKMQNIFAAVYKEFGPHPTDKTVFNPHDKLIEVVKKAYQLVAKNDGYAGMNRGHASLAATDVYYKKHKSDKDNPINELINIRAQQQFIYGVIVDIVNKGTSLKDLRDEKALGLMAGQLGMATESLRQLAVNVESLRISIPEGAKVDSPIQKPKIMTVGEFRAASIYSRFSLRPKSLKEIDYELGKCLDGTKANGRWNLFWKKSEAITMADPLKQWQKLESKLEVVLADKQLDERRKNGIRELLQQVKGQVSYLKDKSSSTMAIYGLTTAALAEKPVPTGSEEHIERIRQSKQNRK